MMNCSTAFDTFMFALLHIPFCCGRRVIEMGLADSVYMCRRDSSSAEVKRICTRKCLTETDVADLPSFHYLHSLDIVQVKGGRESVQKNKTNKVSKSSAALSQSDAVYERVCREIA